MSCPRELEQRRGGQRRRDQEAVFQSGAVGSMGGRLRADCHSRVCVCVGGGDSDRSLIILRM